MNVGAQLIGMDQLVRNLSNYPKKVALALVAQTEISQARIVADAKQTHTFQNRTFSLEASIAAGRVRLTNSLVEGEVVANMMYATFVEFGTSRARAFPFLYPALLREQAGYLRGVGAALRVKP